ncbi:MAG: hypothetical protein KAR20_05255, partial [Candidatus Heimdallarchaeota archaeon]|nr:hypothetical protein [Candidatus Heimdallarchaeota archaeon]
LNVGFSLILSPPLKILLGHIIAGIFIMVPVNFVFITFIKLLVGKFGVITLYMTIFSILTIPTTMFGGVAGIYKLIIGLIIGMSLDLAFLPKKIPIKLSLGTFLGAILWWICLFTVWQLFRLPFVTAFSNLVNSASVVFAGSLDLSPFLSLPITSFSPDFFLFALICGGLSGIPCLLASLGGLGLFRAISRTSIYDKFQQMH